MEHSFDKTYWDQIWQGDRVAAMGTSSANPHLVREISDLAPGTALDAGCGAGAEAIWLAQRGWHVTAADVSADALAIASERAAVAGVANQVTWVEADLSTWEPDARYDLVTTHYAHPAMPQLDFYERIASWVAPTGALLIVGHLHQDHGSARGHDGDPDDSGPPASASATAAGITSRLDPTVWEVVTSQESRSMTGPGGQASTIHDVIVRAARLA